MITEENITFDIPSLKTLTELTRLGRQDIEKVISRENSEQEVLRKKSNVGYDVRTESFGNMFDIGILDPYKVVRCALENAVSSAVMLLSVGCCLIDVEKESLVEDI